MTRRPGFSLLEVTVAGVLLTTLLVVCLQMLAATATRRRAVRDRQTALRTAANVMERLWARPWDELTPQSALQTELPAEVRESLAEAELQIDLSQPAGEPDAKRIAVELHWQTRSGLPERPVRLVAWKFRRRPIPDP